MSRIKYLITDVDGSQTDDKIHSLVFSEKIPANSIVFGQSPNLTVKTYTRDYIRAKLVKEWIFEDD